MSDWIEWKGGPSPVTDDQVVEVRYWDGMVIKERDFGPDVLWLYSDEDPENNIEAYRIVEEGK